MNINDTACSDPFNPGLSSLNLYDSECKSGVENRVGLFPARFCLKVSGYRSKHLLLSTTGHFIFLPNTSNYLFKEAVISKLLLEHARSPNFWTQTALTAVLA